MGLPSDWHIRSSLHWTLISYSYAWDIFLYQMALLSISSATLVGITGAFYWKLRFGNLPSGTVHSHTASSAVSVSYGKVNWHCGLFLLRDRQFFVGAGIYDIAEKDSGNKKTAVRLL